MIDPQLNLCNSAPGCPDAKRCTSVESSLLELTAEISRLRSELNSLRAEVLAPTAPPAEHKAVMSLDEAAKYLGVSRRSVERYIAARRIHSTKLTPGPQGSVRILKSMLDRFLTGRTR